MKNQHPLWMSDEGLGTGFSIQRLVMNQSWREIALALELGDTLPKAVLPRLEGLHVAKYLVLHGLRLEHDGTDYWYVERSLSRRKPLRRHPAGVFKAVR